LFWFLGAYGEQKVRPGIFFAGPSLFFGVIG